MDTKSPAQHVLFVSLWLLGLALLTTAPARAAQVFHPVLADPLTEPWRWRTFPELSGLGLQCLTEGANGTMWFGTAAGASSYDGLEWTAYGKTNGIPGQVDSLSFGPGKILYAGGAWGIAALTTNNFERIWPLSNEGSPLPRNFPAVKRLVTGHDGTLWAATSWGLLRHKGSDWVLYTGRQGAALMKQNPVYPPVRVEVFPDSVLAPTPSTQPLTNRFDFSEVQEDRQGRVWLGTWFGEILSYQPASSSADSIHIPAGLGGQWTLYTPKDGMFHQRWPHILQLQDNTICVVAWRSPGQATWFNGSKWQTRRAQGTGMPDECNSLLQTRDGVFWMGGHGAIAAERGGVWQLYDSPNVPIPSESTLLYQSSDGALWIAGQDAEVVRLDYQTPRWTTYRDLNFQWQSPQGVQWFIHRDGRVVAHDCESWTSYGPEDGVIDAPTSLLGTSRGDVWVAGSHNRVAASSRFDGRKWTRVIHDDLSWAVDWRCLYEAANGSVWLGASAVPARYVPNYQYGLVEYHNGEWIRHTVHFNTDTDRTHSSAGKYHGLGESRQDGKFWKMDAWLSFQGGDTAGTLSSDQAREMGEIEALFTSREGELWVGTRRSGVFRYDGRQWQRYHIKEGLAANGIYNFTQTPDGTIWAAGDRGVSRFDGQSWTSGVLPASLNVPGDSGSLKASPSGALWINRFSQDWLLRAWPESAASNPSNAEFSTICFQMGRNPPRTYITLATEKVSQPGNLMLAWQAIDPWRATPDSRLQFSFRLDSGAWSPYQSDQQHPFFSVPSGSHHFEVRARDDDLNVDPHPAALDFVVLPPIWKQAWFLCLLTAASGIIAFQAARIISRGRNLRRANRALAAEVEERKRAQAEVERVQQQLIEASRRAGMAEVATNVLHNVGNALNSVNVSADTLAQRVRRSPIAGLPKLAGLLAEHAHEPNFLATHEKGRHVPGYLLKLSDSLAEDRGETLKELGSLQSHIEHIKGIVASQQEHAHPAAFTESVDLTALVENAMRLNEDGLAEAGIVLLPAFAENPTVVVEKHKVIQILVTLLQIARVACEDSRLAGRQISVRTSRPGPDCVRVEVSHNGLGIPAENLTLIFQQAFTTGKTGGPGLHDAANAAKSIGGSLTAQSPGPAQGATFVLEFPVNHPKQSSAAAPSLETVTRG